MDFEVPDDGDIDALFKQEMMRSLRRVNDREDYLYTEVPVEEGKSASPTEQDVYWGVTIKQFLRQIEQLLRSDEIEQAKQYYQEIEIGRVELVPRNTENAAFEDYANGVLREGEFRVRNNIMEQAELPQKEYEVFRGLKSVIDTTGVVSKEWRVPTKNGSVLATADEKAVPKKIYENAFREAIDFLGSIGIGFDVQPEPYTGEGEPGL